MVNNLDKIVGERVYVAREGKKDQLDFLGEGRIGYILEENSEKKIYYIALSGCKALTPIKESDILKVIGSNRNARGLRITLREGWHS